MADLLSEGLKAVSRALIEFGYPDADETKIAAAHERWKRRQEPADIVEMFAVKEFDERPEIFGEQGEEN